MRTCSIDGCNGVHYGHGWCNKHYSRWRTNGDPLVTRKSRSDGPLIERLQDRISVESPGCWIWTGYLASTGYGMFTYGDKNHMAHRIVWETLIGPIPEGMELDHLCRVRACVNPDHLEPVLHVVNVRRGASPAVLNAKRGRCLRGHEMTPENTREYRPGKRTCLACAAAHARRYRAERRALAASG